MIKGNVMCEKNLGSSLFSIFIATINLMPETTLASDYFNPAALEQQNNVDPSRLDLNMFSESGQNLPGTYFVDIYINGGVVDSRNINFVKVNGRLQAELTPSQFERYGVKVLAFPALASLPKDKPIVGDIGHYISNASVQFDFNRQRLNVSIPQAALSSTARDYVDPATWDQGMPAAMLDYSFSGAHTKYAGNKGENTSYLNLRSGLNLGAWRLRNYSYYYTDSNGQRNWDNINSYVRRDVASIKSQLVVGDSTTRSEIFDNVKFRGVELYSDDNMVPDSLRGFAPVVRGIAQTNAQVTVRQKGFVIYQTYVAPGAFEIKDLYPASTSGDLDITITESDGRERNFKQLFSAVPVMLREGRLKYDLVTGEYRTQSESALKPKFGQGSLSYGLPYDTTIYGGLIFSEKYNSQAIGIGHGFAYLGSLSFDVTQARTTLSDNRTHAGQSYAIRYSKDLEPTKTTFSLASYRYSTRGFYTFQEANDNYDVSGINQHYARRNKIEAQVNQSLYNNDSIYVSAHREDFWGREGYVRNISAGYNSSYKDISFGINYNYAKSTESESDQNVAFNIQVPLNAFLPNSWASYSMNTYKGGNTTQMLGISGTTLADNQLQYNVKQSYGNHGIGATGSANASYTGGTGLVELGYNYDRDMQQVNYRVQGGVVAHPYGVTLSQSQGDTLALVRAPGAAYTKIDNATGLYTDSRGYAVVPYLSTYRRNRIGLDTTTLADDVDIDNTSQQVTPTHGAVVLADFNTRVGQRVIVSLRHRNQWVPFGATASLESQDDRAGTNSGIVGAEGQVYLSGMPEQGQLLVAWGSGDAEQCRASFKLPQESARKPVTLLNMECL